MDDVLRAVMEPVLRDLSRTGIAPPRIDDRHWTDDPDSPSVMLWSPDGSGTGAYVSRSAPEFERIAMVADQMQEWVIEELWATTATNWPRCPRHPDSHPMKVSTRAATAVWTCPADEVVISIIGEL